MNPNSTNKSAKKSLSTNYIQEKMKADASYRAGRSARSLLSSWFKKALIADHHDEAVPRSKKLSAMFGVSTNELFASLIASTDAEVNPFTYGSVYEIDHIKPVAWFKNPLDAFYLENVRIVRKEQNRPGGYVARNIELL